MIGKLLEVGHNEFPEALRNIANPPVGLYCLGDVSALSAEHLIAIIGTREPSEEGMKVAREAGRIAARLGYVVVNGLALGVDTAALKGALDEGGRCVVTLPSGLDDIYPPSNKELADRIEVNRGCLVSEYPDGSEPQKHTFIERDRLQSGLSDAVIVIEADKESGTMHTTGFARRQGKRIACYISPELKRNSGGEDLVALGQATEIRDFGAMEAFMKHMLSVPKFTQMRLF